MSFGKVALTDTKKKGSKKIEVGYARTRSLLTSIEHTYSRLGHRNFVDRFGQATHANPRGVGSLTYASDDHPVLPAHCHSSRKIDNGTYCVRSDYDVRPSPLAGRAAVKIHGDKGQGKTHLAHAATNCENPCSRDTTHVDAFFRDAPDNYENMKKAFFDPYSEDLDDLRDGKLFMATATENDVAASVVAIIPATQPDISKDHFVVWSNNRVSFWSDNIADMNTTPDNEILVGDVSIMVVDDHGMARGIAVYMETLNGASRALSLRPLMPSWGEERDKHGKVTKLRTSQRCGPGREGSALVGRDMAPVNLERDFVCISFFEFAMSPIKIPHITREHLQIDTFPLDTIISTDYAWICEVLGHEGASSKHPCVKCEQTDDEIQCRECTSTPATRAAAKRRTCATIAANYERHVQNGATHGHAKKAGRGNIHRKPLLHIEPSHIAPIVLHIFLGVWVKLWELYLAEVGPQLDNTSEEMIERRSKAAEADVAVQSMKETIKSTEGEIVEHQTSKKEMDGRIKEIKQSHACAQHPHNEAAARDAGYTTAEWQETYSLMRLTSEAEDQISACRKSIVQHTADLKQLVEHAAAAHALVTGEPGPYERALEEYLRSIHVVRQAYYSGAFVGNHVWLCLKNANDLAQVAASSTLPPPPSPLQHRRALLKRNTDERV